MKLNTSNPRELIKYSPKLPVNIILPLVIADSSLLFGCKLKRTPVLGVLGQQQDCTYCFRTDVLTKYNPHNGIKNCR